MIIMTNKRRLLVGVAIISILLISVLGTISFARESEQKTKATRNPGDLLTEITGNVLYTPILLDFESDGKIEIVVGSHDTIRCLEDPDGDGSWSERWANRIGSSIHNSPNIADVDGDGEVEVLMISESADSLFAIDNNGNTKWQYNYRNVGGFSDCHSSVASGDLNMDGTLETIFSPQGSGTMVILDEFGNEDVIGGGSMSSGGWHSSPAIGDLDGNPTSLEFIHQGAAGTIFAVRMGGAMLWQKNLFSPTTSNPSPAIGDLNQDGINEVVVVSETSNKIYCLDGPTGNEVWSFNMESGSLSSPALVDLDVDELWEVVIGDSSGNLYCITDDGKLKWKVDLGADIKPSPAVADIDSDGLLEVVEVNNDGNCFAVDDTGEIMWHYDTHEGIPTSSVTADPSPVIGDINSDGYLEVVFATGSGTLRALQTDGQVPSSALPWPMFRYDREHTGFYNGTLEYGASLTVDEEHTDPGLQSPLIHFIEPGATTKYNLTLTNVGHQSVIVGMFRDRFTLSTENVPENWTASITAYNVPINDGETVHEDPHNQDFVRVDKIEHIQLEERGSIDFTMEITAPKANVTFGDFAAINAFAMSEGDNNATDSITTTTFIDIIVDMDISIGAEVDPFTEQKICGISAGGDRMLNVELVNTGNINDTYDIDIRSGIPSGWSVSFETNDDAIHNIENINLPCPLFGAEESRTSFSVYIHCPITAEKDDHLDITITATSQVSEASQIDTITNEDTVVMIVEETNLLLLEMVEETKKVNPGETETYTAVVTNRGNSRATVLLTVENPQQNDDVPQDEKWIVYWDTTTTQTHTVELRQHEPVSLKIKVKCPEEAIAGTRIVINVRAENVDDPSVVVTTSITAIVNEMYQYQVNLSETAKNILPGRSLEYEVNIDIDDNGVPEKVPLWGKRMVYNFTIENTGNTQDQIQFYIKDLPSVYWTGYFLEDGLEISNIFLDRFEKRSIQFVVFLPQDALADVYDLGITFRGKGDTELDGSVDPKDDPHYRVVKLTVFKVHDITIDCLNKDVSPDGMELYINTDPNSQTSYTFKVTNNGNCVETMRIEVGNYPYTWNVFFASIANRLTGALTENKIKKDFSETIDMTTENQEVNYVYNNKTDFALVNLGIDECVWITMNIHIPRDIQNKNMEVFINTSAWNVDESEAFAEKNPDDNQVALTFNIANAELGFGDNEIGHEPNMKDGQTYSLTVIVDNSGEIQAENVVIRLKIDGEEIDEIVVEIIGAKEKKMVSFAWTATGGEHKIVIEIDPFDDIVEVNDHYRGINNNILTKNVEVEGEYIELLGIPAISWAIFAAILIIGTGLIVFVGRIIQKRKN